MFLSSHLIFSIDLRLSILFQNSKWWPSSVILAFISHCHIFTVRGLCCTLQWLIIFKMKTANNNDSCLQISSFITGKFYKEESIIISFSWYLVSLPFAWHLWLLLSFKFYYNAFISDLISTYTFPSLNVLGPCLTVIISIINLKYSLFMSSTTQYWLWKTLLVRNGLDSKPSSCSDFMNLSREWLETYTWYFYLGATCITFEIVLYNNDLFADLKDH